MLINRLYKSKNNPSNNKQLPKPEMETNLLFYVSPYLHSKPKRNHLKNNNQKKCCHSLREVKDLPLAMIFPLSMSALDPLVELVEEGLFLINKSSRLGKAYHLDAIPLKFLVTSKWSRFHQLWCLHLSQP